MSHHLLRVKFGEQYDPEYLECVEDLLSDEMVLSMQNFIQHGDVSCLDHCLKVSYTSFKISKRLKLDHRSAARGALLHDFFLYDWHHTKTEEGLHGFVHSRIAHRNAIERFELNGLEQDIIIKHMWPLNMSLPKFKESYLVCFIDKYCATLELEFINVNIKKWKVSQTI